MTPPPSLGCVNTLTHPDKRPQNLPICAHAERYESIKLSILQNVKYAKKKKKEYRTITGALLLIYKKKRNMRPSYLPHERLMSHHRGVPSQLATSMTPS